MDTKTGEMHKVTNIADAQAREKTKEFFERQIISDKNAMAALEKALFNGKRPTRQEINEASISHPTDVLLYFHFDDRFSTMLFINALYSAIIDIDNRVNSQVKRIEKQIRALSRKTGTDITKITKDVDSLKDTVGPKVSAVIELLSNMQKEGEKKKKNGGQMIV